MRDRERGGRDDSRVTAAAPPRLLFVLSNDYGELSLARAMLRGQALDAAFVMPERLYTANADAAPGRVARFDTAEDVLGAVDRVRPDLVCLFSGYLYAINGLLPLEKVAALVDALRARRVRIATSDPFLGVLARMDATTFSDRHPRKAWLTTHFGALARVYADVPHVYPVPLVADGVRAASFFNPATVTTPETLAERRRALHGWIPIDPGRPRWLFVLAHEDYGAQANRLGRARFESLLVARLRETVAAGRTPVLVAPPPCAEAVARAGVAGAHVVPFCGHDRFMALLADAEHAFYWNVFSNSIPSRALSGQSVFFFDQGHMALAMPGVFAAGMRAYWGAATPSYLDVTRSLSAADLDRLGAAQIDDWEADRQRYRRAPSPAAMVQALIATG